MREINSIYIIDDDPITVFGIKKMLGSVVNDGVIHSFANGKLAIDAIRDITSKHTAIPEVIFLDINMPIMDGWQFLEEFIQLSLPKKVRINIITSSIDSADIGKWEHYRLKSHHVITFNNKPIKKEKIDRITKVA